jgi:hypothetical protein
MAISSGRCHIFSMATVPYINFPNETSFVIAIF